MLATLLDTAAACSVHSTLEPGELYTSLDLTVKFLRPVTIESGRLRAVGKVLQRGRRTALAEAQLFDERRPAGRPRDVQLHDLPAPGLSESESGRGRGIEEGSASTGACDGRRDPSRNPGGG